ncbi:hypothetical protein ACFPN0_08080 [Kitasatospora cinereorecta]
MTAIAVLGSTDRYPVAHVPRASPAAALRVRRPGTPVPTPYRSETDAV